MTTAALTPATPRMQIVTKTKDWELLKEAVEAMLRQTMTTPLTPAELIKDIKSLVRIERDWSYEGRLDCITEADLKAKRAELMDQLRERFTTGQNENFIGHGDSWFAHEGDMDCDLIGNVYVPVIPVAYGNTELEAIETLLELIGEDA